MASTATVELRDMYNLTTVELTTLVTAAVGRLEKGFLCKGIREEAEDS